MTAIRADVAGLLRAGLSDRAIARELHTDGKAVAAARAALGLPKAKSGPPAHTPEEAFHRRATATPDGHMKWTGHINNAGVPIVLAVKERLSAYRVAFRIHHGREPIGTARPACGQPGCVAPAHIDDQPARERNRAAFTTLFGGLA